MAKPKSRQILLVLAVLALAAAGAAWWGVFGRTGPGAAQQASDQQQTSPIGGAFSLIDQDGNIKRDSDFHGHLMLVFFGFTHCPDICPVTTASLSKAMDLLGDKAGGVIPVFITVDPERDTPAVLKDYLAHFNRHLVGLTGTPGQISTLALAYRAYFAKIDVPWDEAGHAEHHDHDHEDYNVDHSAFIYLMDKDGNYITHFAYDADPQEIATAVELHL